MNIFVLKLETQEVHMTVEYSINLSEKSRIKNQFRRFRKCSVKSNFLRVCQLREFAFEKLGSLGVEMSS